MHPGFEELVGDEQAMAVWELVRRTRRVVAAARVAELCGQSQGGVQRHLDRLEQHGLVRIVRSRGGLGYEPVSMSQLPGDHRERAQQVLQRLERARSDGHLRRLMDRATSRDGTVDGFGMSVRLGDGELAEVRRRVDELRRFLLLTQQGAATGRGRGAAGGIHCTHHVAVHVLPVPDGELPLPDGRESVAGQHGEAASRPLESLSPREREVAMALLGGSTMRQVAESLGLSFYTVDTLVRRVYRKLGVKRRTEFVMRMRDAERA